MSEPVIRQTRPTDINALKDLDLKCYHYPLELEDWQDRIKNSGKPSKSKIMITEVYRKPVAYGMWTIDQEHNGVHLERVGVLPKFRRNGLAARLVQACLSDGYHQGCEEVRVIAPSVYCVPGEEDDISVFLNKCGFKTNGEIVHSMCKMYGETVDGYIFVRSIYGDS